MQHRPMLNSVRDHLRAHFLEEHTIDQICARFATNEYILKLGFRMLFGHSVFSYLQRLRMAHARKELMNTERSMKEIANEAGYKHVHHFSTAFRKRFGITPARLRMDGVVNEW